MMPGRMVRQPASSCISFMTFLFPSHLLCLHPLAFAPPCQYSDRHTLCSFLLVPSGYVIPCPLLATEAKRPILQTDA